jgi:hypothetical protein
MGDLPSSLSDILRAGKDPQAILEETIDAETHLLLLETFGSEKRAQEYFFHDNGFLGCSPYLFCKDKKPECLEMLKAELYNIQYGNLA